MQGSASAYVIPDTSIGCDWPAGKHLCRAGSPWVSFVLLFICKLGNKGSAGWFNKGW